MSKQLITRLSDLKMQRDYLLRQIDIYYYDKKKRQIHFNELKLIDSEIEKTKFLINLERRLKNEQKNTNH